MIRDLRYKNRRKITIECEITDLGVERLVNIDQFINSLLTNIEIVCVQRPRHEEVTTRIILE